MPHSSLVRSLARAFLAGRPEIDELIERAQRTLGRRWRWLPPLAERYAAAFGGRTRPRQREVLHFLVHDPGFERARSRYPDELTVERWFVGSQRMQPVEAAEGWDIPLIESAGALADWFWLDPGELAWFADLKGLGYKQISPRLRHYHYRVLTKRSGNVRLIEAPKSRLKKLQRQILVWILDKIPSHSAVHGFVKGRSIRSFALAHVGQRVVLRMDLRDFFPGLPAARIQTVFRTMGYPESVADLLGGICTNATPRHVWTQDGLPVDRSDLIAARRLYSRPHLPQGAPTSPALANLCAYRVDCRLAGLAASAGAVYTRYADDLAFSGGEEFDRCVERFSVSVGAFLLEEGFAANHRKTRIMRQGVRQHLAGLVTNQRVNVPRNDFDRLKAILNNCRRSGPDSQNREKHPHFRSHLEGRISFVEMINPAKGERLRRLFESIPWP